MKTINPFATKLACLLLLTSLFVQLSTPCAPAREKSIQQPTTLAVDTQAVQESAARLRQDPAVAPVACTECSRGGSCRAVCSPKLVTKDVKKHCWNVKPKLVCIPGFRLPWDRSATTNPSCGDRCTTGCASCGRIGGKVRCVNVLEKHEYKCKKCSYEWEVKYVRSSPSCCEQAESCPSCGAASAALVPATVRAEK